MTTFWTWSYRYESGILPSSYYYETREKALQALAESLNDDEGLSDEDNHQGREVVKALLPDGELFDAWIEELGCHITLLSMKSWEERDTRVWMATAAEINERNKRIKND